MLGVLESATQLPLWAALAASYLLGAVPFGLLTVRMVKGVDLRSVGSGNIGATNAMRVLGKPLGLMVFLLDCFKGYAAAGLLAPLVAAGGALGPVAVALSCGAAAVLGHCFPVYLGFRGGKGVATACGALIALDPLLFAVGGLVWLATLKATRYVGLASVLMGVSFPITAAVRHPGDRPLLYGMLGLALLIVVRHRSNLARLLRGEEPKTGGPGPGAVSANSASVAGTEDPPAQTPA